MDKSFSVVVGAGPVGRTTARVLAESGRAVRLISRSGAPGNVPGVDVVAADATDAVRLAEIAAGATTVFNCAMPPYDRWPEEFPPLSAAVLAAAERAGADYVMLGNTYGYGEVDGPITEDFPLTPTTVKGKVRAQMWQDALAAHQQGRVKVAEVRASEYLGAGAASGYTLTVLPAVLAGREVAYPGDIDAPKSWSYVADVARTLVAAGDATDWGRAWHVPSVATRSVRALTHRVAELAGVVVPTFRRIPIEELRRLGEDNPIIAETVEMAYLNENPQLLDSADTEARLGITSGSLDEALREMIQGA
ncbi:MAG: NAD-dependent epimerase/dehydratase family protein [Kribbellaceae bacterium]|nr:NAD-dependent epimerase/dehydratase family protein [Kribbellaceae bacterium]